MGGADVNALDNCSITPLHLAAAFGHLKVCMLLIIKGASADCADLRGITAFYEASLAGHNEIALYLQSKGADYKLQPPATVCFECYRRTTTLFSCSVCLTPSYCSKECQTKSWREGGDCKHKIQCSRIVEMRKVFREKTYLEYKGAKASVRYRRERAFEEGLITWEQVIADDDIELYM